MVVLKLIFLRALYDWMAALSGHSFSNLLDFFLIVVILTNLCSIFGTQPVYLEVPLSFF